MSAVESFVLNQLPNFCRSRPVTPRKSVLAGIQKERLVSTSTIRETVQAVLDMLDSRLQDRGIWLTVDVPAVVVPLSERSLQCALYGMLMDAMEHMGVGGDLSVTVYADEDVLELEVADSAETCGRRIDSCESVELLAQQCGGKLRWVHCAQGGTARILQLPLPRHRAAA